MMLQVCNHEEGIFTTVIPRRFVLVLLLVLKLFLLLKLLLKLLLVLKLLLLVYLLWGENYRYGECLLGSSCGKNCALWDGRHGSHESKWTPVGRQLLILTGGQERLRRKGCLKLEGLFGEKGGEERSCNCDCRGGRATQLAVGRRLEHRVVVRAQKLVDREKGKRIEGNETLALEGDETSVRLHNCPQLRTGIGGACFVCCCAKKCAHSVLYHHSSAQQYAQDNLSS